MDIFFIINPIAGAKIRRLTESVIYSKFSHKENRVAVHYSERAGHCFELAKQAVEDGYDTVVVAGGDGTINEVASALLNTGVRLGLVPIGSGNGLAHHIGIPMKVVKALNVVKEGYSKLVDAGVLQNEGTGTQYFYSNCGIGYDAEVIHAYSKVKSRGFLTYIFFMFKSILTLNPNRLRIEFNDIKMDLTPFVFSIANSSQYGYKIKVAPEASISDGILDALLVKDAKFLRVLKFAITSSLNMTDSVKDAADFYRTTDVKLHFPDPTKLQIDGEPFVIEGDAQVSILPGALNLILPGKNSKV